MKPSTSKIDPERLGTKSVLISKVKAMLIEQCEPVEITAKSDQQQMFNQMDLKEQLTYQMQQRKLNKQGWVHRLPILPQNIVDIKMNDADVSALQTLRNERDTTKLREQVEPIDVDHLMKILLPSMTQPDVKLNAIVCGLLLTTGRRTVEILKSAELYLGDGMTSSGYTAMFKGQAKDSLFGSAAYMIPLLAPFNICKAALDRVRDQIGEITKDLPTDDINAMYSRGINNYLKRVTKLDIAPHTLRAVYAMTTYELLPGKKMSLIGHLGQVLGHANPTNAVYYQRVKVINIPLLKDFEYPTFAKVAQTEDGWVVQGAAQQKRLATIKEIMLHKIKITASAVRALGGGTMKLIQKLIDANADRIDKYNKSIQ